MEDTLAIMIGILYAAGIYLVLRRSVVKLILGISFLTQASNLLLLWSGGIKMDRPPILGANQLPTTDPLPQALILTAIVISFSLLAFLLVLVSKASEVNHTEDVDKFLEGEE